MRGPSRLLVFDETACGDGATPLYSDIQYERLLAALETLAVQVICTGLNGTAGAVTAYLEQSSDGRTWTTVSTLATASVSGRGVTAFAGQQTGLSALAVGSTCRIRVDMANNVAARVKVYVTGRIKDCGCGGACRGAAPGGGSRGGTTGPVLKPMGDCEAPLISGCAQPDCMSAMACMSTNMMNYGAWCACINAKGGKTDCSQLQKLATDMATMAKGKGCLGADCAEILRKKLMACVTTGDTGPQCAADAKQAYEQCVSNATPHKNDSFPNDLPMGPSPNIGTS